MNTKIYIAEKHLKKSFLIFVSFQIFMALIYLLNNILDQPYYQINSFFSLDGEFNIPALFSMGQLFLVSVVFFSISYNKKKHKLNIRIFFLILSFGFLFLCFDEYFAFHERASSFLKTNNTLGLPSFKGNHGYWILPYILFCVLFVILSFRTIIKIWSEYKKEMKIILVGIILFLFGAVGLEIISYEFLRAQNSNYDTLFYIIEVVFEELSEMMGISLILFSTILIRNKTYNT